MNAANLTSTPLNYLDKAVNGLRDLQREENRVEDEIHGLQTQERQQQQSYREFEELRRRYRRRGYDSRHSHFPGGFEMGALLAIEVDTPAEKAYMQQLGGGLGFEHGDHFGLGTGAWCVAYI